MCVPHTLPDFQPSEYNKWKLTHSPTFLEVLEEFPSLRVPASFLLSQLPLLKARYYSISSSADHSPSELHLTVAVLTYHTRGKAAPQQHAPRLGTATRLVGVPLLGAGRRTHS